MSVLSIDPGRSYKGEATIGYCLFEGNGTEIERGSLTFEELARHLGYDEIGLFGWGRAIHTVVIEDFINDPQSARGGQRNGTSECIGGVEMLCLKGMVPMIRQRRDILPAAKLHAGYVDRLKHLPHEDSAYLHGHEYFVQKGVLKVPGLSSTI